MVMHPAGYLRGVRELTQKYGVLLIADEVAVGFGRTGKMFACEHESVTPDFLCLAKGISAGYVPFAATLTTEHVWNAFLGRYQDARTFCHGHTYGGNPLGAAVALASLDVFEQEQTLRGWSRKLLGSPSTSAGLQVCSTWATCGDAGSSGPSNWFKTGEQKSPFHGKSAAASASVNWRSKRGFGFARWLM